MEIRDDIRRAVRHISANDYTVQKTEEELEVIAQNTINAFENKSYDFSNFSSMVLKQHNKSRSVKYYEDIYCSENVLCHCVKQILDRTFNIKYPNRNKTIRNLFSYISATIQMSHFTIVKFDFKDYYNSVSAPYVFESCIKQYISRRDELSLLKDFCYSTKYAYAGLCTSNTIAEIIAKKFDDVVKEKLLSNGLLFYERYIDDSILLLNEDIDEDELKSKLKQILKEVFHKTLKTEICQCKTKFKEDKFQYISSTTVSATPSSIDYLGYEFWLFKDINNKTKIKYGITEKKRKKYNKRVDRIINLYKSPSSPDYNNLELLRHRLRAFTSREVYISKHFKSNVWKVKGFISNYGELRYLLDTPLIESDTEFFLKNMITQRFDFNGVGYPYFLKNNGYNLFENLKKNKTLLLVDTIGYDYNSLVSLCESIGITCIDVDGKKRGYGTLVRDYLIKVKVGY